MKYCLPFNIHIEQKMKNKRKTIVLLATEIYVYAPYTLHLQFFLVYIFVKTLNSVNKSLIQLKLCSTFKVVKNNSHNNVLQ